MRLARLQGVASGLRRLRLRRRLALLLLLLPLGEALPGPQVRAMPPPASPTVQPASRPKAVDGLQLKVRRLPDAVELVLENAGLGASLMQQPLGDRWLGELRTDQPRALRVGPQSLSLAADGMDRISFGGGGTSFQLTVMASQGRPLPQPLISSDGRDLLVRFPAAPDVLSQSARPNLLQPTPVPDQTLVPPLRPRAVAPPVGDMAVGTMTIRNRSYVRLSGPPVTLTARGASARDLLMVLAQMGGYGFAFAEPMAAVQQSPQGSAAGGSSPSVPTTGTMAPVTVAFRNEPYERAFNFVLLASGLQARREGNTVIVGQDVLSKSIGAQVSKVYRLNQVSSGSAADYLANLGAKVTKTNTTLTSVTSGGDQNVPSGAPNAATTVTGSATKIEAYGAASGPLMGLQATTDSRLSTITLIGDGDLIAIAEQYLKQLDLRQRQVALTLQILDVNLDNTREIDNSFAFKFGNNFIISDSGKLVSQFGKPFVSVSLPTSTDSNITPPTVFPGKGVSGGDPYYDFYDYLKAQIVSSSTKVLASPTLILQDNPGFLRENGGVAVSTSDASGNTQQGIRPIGIDSPIGRRRANEAVITVGSNVVTSYSVSSTQGALVCTPNLSPAGLVLGARVEKIDDNGFVTFTLSPSISAITGSEDGPEECGSDLNILSVRSLDTGALRVRDGQTLVLTGVISDFDRAEVSKWPILGDIPLIGQFFRASGRRREKRELVILATPRIIDDEQGGTYGYGYRPSTTDARQLLYGTAPR